MSPRFKLVLILISILILFFTKVIYSQISDLRSTLNNFLKYDSAGYRLSSQSIGPVENIIYNFDESCWDTGWDLETIILEYKIDSIIYVSNTIAKAWVTYKIIVDKFNWTELINIENINKTIMFTLKKVDNKWKLIEPCIHPHISIDLVLKKLVETNERMKSNMQSENYDKHNHDNIKQNIEILINYKKQM